MDRKGPCRRRSLTGRKGPVRRRSSSLAEMEQGSRRPLSTPYRKRKTPQRCRRRLRPQARRLCKHRDTKRHPLAHARLIVASPAKGRRERAGEGGRPLLPALFTREKVPAAKRWADEGEWRFHRRTWHETEGEKAVECPSALIHLARARHLLHAKGRYSIHTFFGPS